MDRSRPLPLLAARALCLAVAGCGTASSGTAADDPGSPSVSPSASASEPAPTETSATDSPSPSDPEPSASGSTQPAEPAEPQELGAAYGSFATVGNSLVAVELTGVEPIAVVLDGNLEEVSRTQVRGGSLAVTPDGSIVAWLGVDGSPHVVEAGGGREFDLAPVPQGADIAAIGSDGSTCQEGGGGGYGCAVFVNSGGSSRAWVSSSHGIVDELGSIRAVRDASEGLLLGLVSLSDEGSCWAVFKIVRRTLWETCDHTLMDFSPSGGRILATDAYLDGFGQRSLALLDRDGRQLAAWQGTGDAATTITQMVWEDDDHALAVLYAADEWSIVRFGVDGSTEYAVAPVGAESDRTAFTLPTR